MLLHVVSHYMSCVSAASHQLTARDRHETQKLETETLTSWDRDVGFTSRDETETRRLELSRRDRDVKVQVLLIAITSLDVIFHVHCF